MTEQAPPRGVRAIAFAGMPGAGKTIAVEVATEMGFPVFRMGDAVWAEVRARGLALAPDVVGKVASEMRERHGRGVWADRTADRAIASGAPVVVIDGVRSMDEVGVFRARLGEDFILVGIHAAPRLRLARLLARHREDDVRNEAEFEARDTRELGWGLGAVLALADVMLVNHGSVEGIRREVAAVLRYSR
ncbi:MAG TPA: AAA family ATPase [Candidatus Thermoplasmatota archaeon]|nr:AAA family ATPase [Candidatus Thermoplasmatota archaeon]